MAEGTEPNVDITLTSKEAKGLKQGLEECFKNEKLFTESELEGLERTYDLLMGLN